MITILGRGAWGHALASVLEENKKEYIFWDRKSSIDPKNIVVMAIPTQAIREVLTARRKDLSSSIIVNTSKGIEKGTHKLPFQIAIEVLGKDIKYLSMFGPSFASEVEEKMPTMVNLCSMNTGKELVDKIKKIFETDYFRVGLTQSVEAVELAGGLKNIYAIASGISEGLGFSTNTKAQLIGIAYKETFDLCKGLGFIVAPNAIVGIMGDLVLTCSGPESRNFRFGKYLTKLSVSEALIQVASTVEGRNNCLSVSYFTKKSGLDLKLANFVYQTVKNDSPQHVAGEFKSFIKKI